MARLEQFEIMVSGSHQAIETQLQMFAYEFRPSWGRMRFDQRVENSEHGPALMFRLTSGGELGRLSVIDLFGGRVLIHKLDVQSEADPDGSQFQEFLDYVVRRFEGYGQLSRRSRFACTTMIQSAIRQLSSADKGEDFASIGNTCRIAVVMLGRELFNSAMLASGETAPRGDAAVSNLKIVARTYWGSGRQLDGIKHLIDGVWDLCNSMPHDSTATREGAEIAVTAVTQLFDVFSLLVPEQG